MVKARKEKTLAAFRTNENVPLWSNKMEGWIVVDVKKIFGQKVSFKFLFKFQIPTGSVEWKEQQNMKMRFCEKINPAPFHIEQITKEKKNSNSTSTTIQYPVAIFPGDRIECEN